MAVVIINSNFKRTLVGSEYNTRREQCETGARFFQRPALRDVTIEEFNAVAHELDPIVAKRVRHVLTENARTVEAASALEKGDLKRITAAKTYSPTRLNVIAGATGHTD